MSDKKHIDRLFQEKFKDFEKTPNDAVWSKIEAQLNEKKKRRIIPLWWRYAGVAALLLFLLPVGNHFFNSSRHNNIEADFNIVDTDAHQTRSILPDSKNNIHSIKNLDDNNPTHTNTKINKTVNGQNDSQKTTSKIKVKAYKLNTAKKTRESVNSLSKNKSEAQKTNPLLIKEATISNPLNLSSKENVTHNSSLNNMTVNNSKTLLSQDYEFENTTNKLVEIDPAHTNNNAITTTKTDDATNNLENLVDNTNKEDIENKTETIEGAIAKNKKTVKTKNHINRWRVTPNAAPVYFNTLGKGSSIASQFNNNSKTGEVNTSYGINASYSISKKLSIRSGINRVNLGYNTNNVAVFDRANATTVNLLSSLKDSQTNDVINNNSNIDTNVALISAETVSSVVPDAFLTASSANINQSLGFIEVPVEFQYIVFDKKTGVNLIGGFSSFFLNNNQLFSETNSARVLIGEAINVNSVSYSINFGLGLNYKVSKKIIFNFEPTFKYQINTFNNTSGNFKPYFIGVYTGIGFKF